MALLEANIRSNVGTRDSRILRADGLIPCIIYGHGEDPVAISLSEAELSLAVHHRQRLLEIKIKGKRKKQNVLIKELQWDTFAYHILHADLTRVDLDEKVTVTVPIVLRGTPAGASENGVLQQWALEVRVECLVRAIPEDIRVLVTDMKVGESLLMKDLELAEGAKLLSDPEARVCSVEVIQEEAPAEAEGEAAAAQPEVIGEKTEDQTEGEGASD